MQKSKRTKTMKVVEKKTVEKEGQQIVLPKVVNESIVTAINEINSLQKREEELAKLLNEVRQQASFHSSLISGLLRGELLREGYSDLENWSYNQEKGLIIRDK